MQTFKYQGRDANGIVVSGNVKAVSSDDVVIFLQKHNIVPLSIEETKTQDNIFKQFLGFFGVGQVKLNEIMNFCRQLATLNAAGVPIIKALNQLGQSSRSPILSAALTTISDDIAAGKTLSNAMRNFPNIFSSILINVVEVGENTGHLNETLIQLGGFLEKSIINRRRLAAAVRYPIFVVSSVLMAMIAMNYLVIPKFADMFSKMHLALPWPTLLLIATSTFMIKHWFLIIVIAISIVFGISRLFHIPKFRYLWDKYILRLPVIGDLQKRIVLSQFSWTFSLILSAGVPVIKGITLAGSTTGNSYFTKQIFVMRDAIEHGESFTQAAIKSGLFLPTILQMIEVGEESGRLDDILNEVARYYESEVDYDLKRLNEILEPLLLAIVGACVLVLALAIYLPLWDMVKIAKIG